MTGSGNALGVLDCAGRAQRRRRFRPHQVLTSNRKLCPRESGVALRFPPQSKTP
jgi:hypothetical protein